MRAAIVALMILMAATGASAGEGFLAQIPEPGTWVKYHRTQKNSREGQVIEDFSGSFTVRFLNETSDKDIPCRWIEFELEMGEAKRDRRDREVSKYLVPAACLKENVELASKVVRGWSKQGERDAEPLESLPHFLTAVDLTPPLMERQTHAVHRMFAYQRGQLISEEHVSGMTITNAARAPKVVIRHEICLQKDVPNGAAGVRYDIELRRRDNDGVLQSVVMDHSVVDFGTGAMSSLLDNN